jgi:hypothetical protein
MSTDTTALPRGAASAPSPPAPAPAYLIDRSGKATVSLALGIAGLVVLPLIGSVLAIAYGAMAYNDTERDAHLAGRGRAVAGLTLGLVGLVVGVAALVVLRRGGI